MLLRIINREFLLEIICSRTDICHSFFSNQMKRSKKGIEGKTKITLPVSVDKTGAVRVAIFAKPGAKLSGITAVEDEGISVQIGARPVDGEANIELVRYISDVLNIKKSEISLDKGSKSRQKVLIITAPSLTVDSILEKLKLEAIKN